MARPDSQQPIGVFDSGVGGLSVWREIAAQLPNEHTVYLADQAHVPYGPRSIEEIRHFAIAIADFLVRLDAKLIVVACNTISGAALHSLRAAYPHLPFVGMEPAVKPAVEHTRTGTVGVLATSTTFQGELFRRLVDRFGQDVRIHTQICPGLVELVEVGSVTSAETRALLERCLDPLLALGIDQLVLGCTHYPFVRPLIADLVGPEVTVIDPAPAVVRQVRRVLAEREVLRESQDGARHRFFTSGPPTQLALMAHHLIAVDYDVEAAHWHGNVLRIG